MILYLLKLEWLKIRHNPTALVSFAVYIVAAIGLMFLISMDNFKMGNTLSSSMYQEFPGIFNTGFYMLSWLSMFLVAYQALSLATSEYSQRTLRQNIISGMTRNEWLFGKFIIITVINLSITAFGSIIIIGTGLLNGSDSANIGDITPWVFRFFVFNQGYMSFAFFFGLLLRRSGMAVALVLPYMMFIEDAFRYIIFRPGTAIHEANAIFPIISFDNMVPNPAVKLAALTGTKTDISWSFGFETDLALSIGWIVFFTVMSFVLLRKRDL